MKSWSVLKNSLRYIWDASVCPCSVCSSRTQTWDEIERSKTSRALRCQSTAPRVSTSALHLPGTSRRRRPGSRQRGWRRWTWLWLFFGIYGDNGARWYASLGHLFTREDASAGDPCAFPPLVPTLFRYSPRTLHLSVFVYLLETVEILALDAQWSDSHMAPFC